MDKLPTPKDGKICAAYTITHLKSGCVYIGSTSDVYQRVHNHRSQLKKGIHYCKRFQELYDESDVLGWTYYLTDTREEAYQREQEMIDHNKGKATLLNVAMDAKKSALGVVRSAVTRALLSAHRKGKKLSPEHVEKVRRANTGRKASPEERAKNSASKKGIPKSPEQADRLREMNEAKKKRVLIDGIIYDSQNAAARALDLPACTVAQRIKSQNFVAWQLA